MKKIGERAFFNDKKIAQMKFEGKDTNIEDKTAIDENTFIGCYAGSPVYDFAKQKTDIKLFYLSDLMMKQN